MCLFVCLTLRCNCYYSVVLSSQLLFHLSFRLSLPLSFIYWVYGVDVTMQ
eukprot:m.84040 g.84040  ORF g.84040 m.84040 type:complete len:50 (+) comp12142_c0_seq1:1772-1921(+)